MCVVKAVSCLMNDWRAGVETRSIGCTETYRICHEVWNVATAISPQQQNLPTALVLGRAGSVGKPNYKPCLMLLLEASNRKVVPQGRCNHFTRKVATRCTRLKYMSSIVMCVVILASSVLGVAGQRDQIVDEDDFQSDNSKPQALS